MRVSSDDKHRVEWRRPHFARVISQNTVTTDNTKTGERMHRSSSRNVANRQENWSFSSSFGKDVLQYKSRADHGTATQIVLRSASGSLEELLSGGLAKSVDSACFRALMYLGASSVGNVAVERVQWNFVDGDGAKTSEVLAFDKRGFLRSVSCEQAENDGTVFRQIETFTSLQIDPQLANSTFALLLPKGARLLTAEQMQAEMMREYEIADAVPSKNKLSD